jgi:FkbM family methyltransferase
VREPYRVETPRGPLLFAVLGETAGFRARGLLKKQKDTIAWIDQFTPNSVFWDIGANIGSYGLYAALDPTLRVVAFEPAAVNYFLLSANCELNSFGERMDCLQLGVGGRAALAHLEVSQFDPAMSFSFQARGRRPVAARQASLILSIDELIDEFGLPVPHYVKIDVPAMTGAILEGAARTLRRPELRQLHVEAREDSQGGQHVIGLLAAAGFAIAGRHVHGSTMDITFARV